MSHKSHLDRLSSPESTQSSTDQSVPPPLPPPSRPVFNTLVDLMGYTGMVVSVLALGAGLGEGIDAVARSQASAGSWVILGVAVSLIIFEVCVVFWGPSGGSALALQAVIQAALFSTFLYAALAHNRGHGYFSSEKALYQHPQTTPEEARALTASYEAKKELDGGHFDRALRLFDEAIRLNPKNAADYRYRGDAYKKLGQIERAISDYSQAIQLAPTEALYYVDRGNAYDDLGKSRRAIEDYDAAIRIDQKDAGTYYNRALAYNKLGQHERAIEDYSHAIQLDPNYVQAYENRGWTYQALGKTKQAQTDFDKAKKLRAAR